jgi:hypothetical protein
MNPEEILLAPKLSDLHIDGRFSPNLGRYVSERVSAAVDIAKNLPEDAGEAAAILADAARFHAVIRDRSTSAVFANVLSQIAEKAIDAPSVG